MTKTNTEIMTLNTLAATLIDSVNGYRDAAENTHSERFKEMFTQSSNERNQAAEKLRSRITALGGEPDANGSILGKVHQRFLDLKAAITGRDDKAIINEVERGEDYLKEKFELALKDGDLSPESRTIVEEVFTSVRKGHDQMSSLKHGMEA